MKLWVDEDLSHTLVAVAAELGYVGECNRNRGMLGVSDDVLAAAAISEDFTLVTDNRRDFRKLYAPAGHVHPGLIFIPGGGTRAMQQERLRQAVGWIEWQATAGGLSVEDLMVNKPVEMNRDTLEIHMEWLPVSRRSDPA